jgi:NTP pyrophosphatase (non-canonical NTP hydrolase)
MYEKKISKKILGRNKPEESRNKPEEPRNKPEERRNKPEERRNRQKMQQHEMVTDYGLDALAAILHENAIEKGFWDGPKNFDVVGNKIALIHSEATEVLEAVRKNKGSESIVEEMSDILIRTLDLYAAMRNAGFVTDSLDEILSNKMNKNRSRPKLHGNLF